MRRATKFFDARVGRGFCATTACLDAATPAAASAEAKKSFKASDLNSIASGHEVKHSQNTLLSKFSSTNAKRGKKSYSLGGETKFYGQAAIAMATGLTLLEMLPSSPAAPVVDSGNPTERSAVEGSTTQVHRIESPPQTPRLEPKKREISHDDDDDDGESRELLPAHAPPPPPVVHHHTKHVTGSSNHTTPSISSSQSETLKLSA